MKISFASIEDEKKIKEVLAAGGLDHEDITPSHLQHFLVLKDDPSSTLTGMVGLEIRNNMALLRSLAVIEPRRNKGLATQLVREIEKYARSQQVDTLYLLTLTAERFFAKQGYRKTDRKSAPDAIQETTEFNSLCPATAVCMKKNLSFDNSNDA
jgi:amino-acid N-acetyltransferase